VAPARHLRVVDPEVRRRERRRRMTVWASVTLLVGAVLASVAFHVQLAAGQLKLEKLDARTQVAQRQYEEQRLAVAQARAPQSIVARAKAIGMVEPPDASVFVEANVASGDNGGTPSGDGTTSTSTKDWGEVKPHLDRQP
jgi:hypothetical protein